LPPPVGGRPFVSALVAALDVSVGSGFNGFNVVGGGGGGSSEPAS
jgi:hypothetical protein